MPILIVDDNPRMREMIRAVLEPLDDTIHECSDGSDALQMYRQVRPRWVLMDLAMERMDGLAATRAIRGDDPEARVVVVTEHMEPALRLAAEEAGACAFVLKEDLSALLRVLDPHQSLHKALQASELRFRSLFDRVPAGLYRSTPDGRILDGNAALVELLGLENRDQLINLAAEELYVDRTERLRWRELIEREGVVRDFEVQLRRADGRPIWVRHSARVVLDDRGHVLCYDGALQDVTERRRAEDALRLSESRHRILYDENPSMYFTVDPGGTVLSVNAFGAGQLGYTPPELIGQSVLRVVHPDDHATARDMVAECAANPGQLFGWEFRKVRKDGSVLWVKEAARAARAAVGVVVYIVCEDITEHKRTEEQLRRSETMAAMGSLVMGVAHEVRNPLHAISAMVDVIETKIAPTPDWGQDVGVLRKQLDRLQRLMQDLLEYGRPANAVLKPGTIQEPLGDAVAGCAGLAAQRQVRVESRIAAPLPVVPMDRGRLVQVFTNVLENAIVHSPPGTAVTVDVAPAGRAGVEVCISDRGPGFIASDMPRVFDPFFTRRPNGTGLGLSIVQRIVDQHGGTVEADNAPEGGARIRVRLPGLDP